jgi:hypothetical protein
MASSATIRVQFGDPDGLGGHLSAEIDRRADGLNGGKTSFNPGDTVYILVYKSDNVTLTDLEASAGSVAQTGYEIVTKTDEVFFEKEDSASLSTPADSIVSSQWFGRSLGSITLQADKQTVKSDSEGVAVAQVDYLTTAVVVALTSPASLGGLTDFSVLVVISGTTAVQE